MAKFAPMTKEEMEAAWGGPLPELEQEYYELAKDFVTGRPEMAPYVMKKYFTLEQAQILLTLPGDAESAAEKLGLDAQYVAEELQKMYMVAKVVKTKTGYMRNTVIPFFRNTMFVQKNDLSVPDQQGARLFNAWDAVINYDGEIAGGRPEHTMRIVPKWEAIKDIPGVMPCENLPQMLRDKLENVRFKICPCREVYSYAETGKPYQRCGASGIRNDEFRYGICIGAAETENYYDDINCSYKPTAEELEDMIHEIETKPIYYMINNEREVKNLCCCEDGVDCGIRRPYDRGNKDYFLKTRFLSTVANADACDGCGKCEQNCSFDKSIRVVDGKPVINAKGCHGCGVCVVSCDRKALKLKLIRPASHIPSEDMELDSSWIMKTDF